MTYRSAALSVSAGSLRLTPSQPQCHSAPVLLSTAESWSDHSSLDGGAAGPGGRLRDARSRQSLLTSPRAAGEPRQVRASS
eukprot:7029261-Lingulodinium_polyedra.AAC.1